MKKIRSPKQTSTANAKKALQYYAAFSTEFVEDAIELLGLKPGSVILDPWNGSGTTTLVASQLGFRSIGYDLNPAVKIIAEARMANDKQLVKAIYYLKAFKFTKRKFIVDLPVFDCWFNKSSIHALADLKGYVNTIEDTVVRSLIDVAIVAAIREQLTDFKSKNPAWIKTAKQESELIGLNTQYLLESSLQQLLKFKGTLGSYSTIATLDVANAQNIPLPDESIDAVITSPPYCTRIDYAVATMVELAWLGMTHEQVRRLRLNLIGTPTIRKALLDLAPRLPMSVLSLLSKIKNHPSKASSTYYYKTFSQFFNSMQSSFSELHRVIRPDGQLCLVVQDSFYKEIPIHLPLLFQDMLNLVGFELIDSHLYPAGGLNLIHGHKSINEVALTCRKLA